MAGLYTRTGDGGTTYCAVLKQRVPKDHPIIEFVGTLDEANSMLGLARSMLPEDLEDAKQVVERVQRLLFNAGFSPLLEDSVKEEDVLWAEETIDRLYPTPLKNFILPGGHPAASAIHAARTLLRRAERRLVTVTRLYPGLYPELTLHLLNRLSDLLFALALHVNKSLRVEELEL